MVFCYKSYPFFIEDTIIKAMLIVFMEPKGITYRRQVRKNGGSMQVSIPVEIIEIFGLANHDPVFVTATVEGILIRKATE